MQDMLTFSMEISPGKPARPSTSHDAVGLVRQRTDAGGWSLRIVPNMTPKACADHMQSGLTASQIRAVLWQHVIDTFEHDPNP